MESKSSFIVFDKDCNSVSTLFGGKLMSECDLEAAKVCREIAYGCGADDAVTAHFDVSFLAPAIKGDLVSVSAKLVGFGKTSLRITVECFRTTREGTNLIAVANTVFVVMKDGKPYPHKLKFQ